MNTFTLVAATIFGSTGIILGAFGAHAFKKILSAEKLASFEVGVRYQTFAALFLLVVGFQFDFEQSSERISVYTMILGTIFFSVSIYFLSFSEYLGKNWKFLGPITPLGGLLMVCGWVAAMVSFL